MVVELVKRNAGYTNYWVSIIITMMIHLNRLAALSIHVCMHAIDRCNGIQSMQGLTALHVASEHGHLPLVDFLLNNGSEIDAKTARGQGEAPLHYACRNGHLHIVKLLLVHNASVSVKNIVRTMIMM